MFGNVLTILFSTACVELLLAFIYEVFREKMTTVAANAHYNCPW